MKTILVIDDDETILLLIECVLQPYGYRVLTAKSSAAGLGLLHSEAADLVLLDIVLDGESGFDVLQKIRADEKTKLIPVLLLTSLKGKQDRLKGLELGADDFMSKPFDREELAMRIETLLKMYQLKTRLLMNEKLIAALDLVDEAVVIVSPDLVIQHMNRTASELFEVQENPGSILLLVQKRFAVDISTAVPGRAVSLGVPGQPGWSLTTGRLDDEAGNISGLALIFRKSGPNPAA